MDGSIDLVGESGRVNGGNIIFNLCPPAPNAVCTRLASRTGTLLRGSFSPRPVCSLDEQGRGWALPLNLSS